MDSLEGLWNKLSLSKAKEIGVSYPKDEISPRYIQETKFLTKRVVNIESVAWMFRPLWRSKKEVQINDMGDNILFFNFEDKYDLDRVIEHEPWTYDKHLVVFERVVENVPVSTLEFKYTTFWI